MKKKLNSEKNTCHVLFSLPKEAVEEATSVAVLGDFSKWKPVQLQPTDDGSYEVEIEIPVGHNYHFRYLIDGNRWENDWAADCYEISPRYDHIYNSVVSLVEFGIVEKKAKPIAKAEPAKKPAVKAEATKKAKVAPKKASEKDDLTKIEGIGPKIAGLLNADGIETFVQLSNAKESALQAILDKGGKRYQIHKPTTWAAQAKLAANGEWETLKKWQDELNGGKTE